jgi:proteasome lid subunit RPN8/RPN11
MANLDELLGGEGSEKMAKKRENYGLDSVKITEFAYEKAFAYARMACKVKRGQVECGGYMISPLINDDMIATDSFLARGQDVSEGLYTLEAEEVIKAGREIEELGYKVLGWWHSHGHMHTFFSRTDDGGQMTMLNEISPINYISIYSKKDLDNFDSKVENGKIVMIDKNNPKKRFEFDAEGDLNSIKISKMRILHEENRIGFAYGLVVNAQKDVRKPYAELATREYCGFCVNSKDRSVEVGVNVYDNGDFNIDEDKLEKEVREKVNMKRKKWFNFRGYSVRNVNTSGGSKDEANEKGKSKIEKCNDDFRPRILEIEEFDEENYLTSDYDGEYDWEEGDEK